jgi:hypothetical protein
MRHAITFSGFVAVVAASPAAQAINFAAVNAAPAASLTGPPASANTQYVTYNAASASSKGGAAVTGVASAIATASQNVKRNFIWGWPWGNNPTTTCTTSSSTPIKTSSTIPAQQTTSTTLSSSKQVTTIPTTIISQTATQTTSSDDSCPTTPEPGTYCGFINPEDPCAPQPDGKYPQMYKLKYYN